MVTIIAHRLNSKEFLQDITFPNILDLAQIPQILLNGLSSFLGRHVLLAVQKEVEIAQES